MDFAWTSLLFKFGFNLTMLAFTSRNYLIAMCSNVYDFDNTFLRDASRFETQNITHVGFGHVQTHDNLYNELGMRSIASNINVVEQ